MLLQLEKFIRKLNACPENIYNMAEKGFMLGQTSKVKVTCPKGQRNPHYSQDGNWKVVMVIECISAAGTIIPPMYIYKSAMHLLG
jgi:hypothetical protein